MVLTVIATLPDHSVTVRDDADGFQATVPGLLWDELTRLPESEKRTRVEQEAIAAKTRGDARTRATQDAPQTREAHHDQERD